MSRVIPWPRAVLVLLSLAALPGCFAFGKRDHDIDHTPIVNAGVGATILMPGQQAPIYSPGGQSWGSPGGTLSHASPGPGNASGAAPAPAAGGPPVGAVPVPVPAGNWSGTGSSRGSGNSNGWGSPASQQGSVETRGPAGGPPPGSVTFIGGAESNEVEHLHYQEEPIWFKYVTLPFAVIAAPFKIAAEKLEGDPEPGPEVPRATTPMPQGPPPAPAQEASRSAYGRYAPPNPAPATDYESQRMAELDRQLGDRTLAPGAPRPAVAGQAGPSIADELSALRNRRAASRSTAGVPLVASGPQRELPLQGRSSAAPLAAPEAGGRVDRNGDGRPDQWLERRGGALVRELRDDDFDGRAELAVDYDPASGEVRSVEEDQNRDGTPDSWTDYRGGRPLSQRRDADFDGRVDTWTSYSDGDVSRIERDTNADGSPDRSAYYGGGKLVREELDEDRDGRVDVTLRYDDEQRLATREEDTDHDGQIDVISHYEGGRLVRRELATQDQARSGAPQS